VLQATLASVESRQQDKQATAAERIKSHEERAQLIEAIESSRGSPVICYVTANRSQLGAQIGGDVTKYFQNHLEGIGKSENLNLFLVTRGGNTLAPTRLVSLLREYCKRLTVIVPFMAHSAGTLIALGADQIVMGRMGELGPVDPSVGNQFNPVLDPADVPPGKLPTPRPRIPISVEDLAAYLTLARERAGLGSGQHMVDAFKALTDKLHPLALGNIHRQHMLIRRLVRRLLAMHMSATEEREKIDQIAENLTEKLHAHEYIISREEAKNEMGLKVTYAGEDLEPTLWSLYRLYEDYLRIDREIDAVALLGDDNKKYAIIESAVIEGRKRLHVFAYRGWFSRKGQEINYDGESAGWEEVSLVHEPLGEKVGNNNEKAQA